MKEQLKDADCVLVNPFGFVMDKSIIDMAPHLKFIDVLATAYGKVDTVHAKKKGITVSNIPGYSTESVAEFVFGILLEHLREIERAKQQGRKGPYSEVGYQATEIKGKIFGVFGTGRIGLRVAELANAFGADTRYYSRQRKKELEKLGIKYEEPDALLEKCDIISLHFALAKETENFLNSERIKKLKKSVIVINLAPVEFVDYDALEERLKKGELTYVFDHSDEMPEPVIKRLSKYKNFIAYPPIAYISKEARIAKQEIFIENIKGFLKGAPTNKVN